MEPSVSPELEEESIIIVYTDLETGLFNMERSSQHRAFELPWQAFIFSFLYYRGKIKIIYQVFIPIPCEVAKRIIEMEYYHGQ